jgi:hypothetical protein
LRTALNAARPKTKRTPSTSRTLVESGGGRINLKGRLSIKKDVVALAALFCDPFSWMGKNLTVMGAYTICNGLSREILHKMYFNYSLAFSFSMCYCAAK